MLPRMRWCCWRVGSAEDELVLLSVSTKEDRSVQLRCSAKEKRLKQLMPSEQSAYEY